eukprot:jgi/Botrbrau1/2649/Bobra.0203s0003.1
MMRNCRRCLFTLILHVFVSCCTCEFPNLLVRGDDVAAQLMELARCSDVQSPAVTRILFSEADVNGRRYIKQLMKDAGLEVREDTMGSIFGRWPGSIPSAAPVFTGSHIDAIPLSGAYDGTLGVVGGIAAINALKRAGFKPQRSIEVVMFTSEEPTRFGLSCLGSRAMAGVLDARVLEEKKDCNGSTLLEAAREAGYEAESPQQHGAGSSPPSRKGVRLCGAPHRAGAFARGERHSDWSRDSNCGASRLAGLLFRIRRSCRWLAPCLTGLAAAELALAVEKAALATGSVDTVGTTGRVVLEPNTVNSVPREAVLEIDVRDIQGPRRDDVVAAILEAAQEIAERRGVSLSHQIINQDPPATCSSMVQDAAVAAAEELDLQYMRMVSRAYHDSLFMAQVAPTGMIFIPCRGGWSHRPDEYASPEHIEKGVKVLALTLARLSNAAAHDTSEL